MDFFLPFFLENDEGPQCLHCFLNGIFPTVLENCGAEAERTHLASAVKYRLLHDHE